jgi:hypothetical protein
MMAGTRRTYYAAWSGLIIIVALVLGGQQQDSGSVTAADTQGPSPFVLATKYAGIAAQAKQLALIHQHLQYVLNCLEGPTGPDYKEAAGNPCTGPGALQTLPEGSANRVRAQKAIALARVGVTLHDVSPAHYVAQAIHDILIEDQR